jgi:glyoxylase-like metal-dependent hydrolase (beta-lactamase superfamily II)
MPREIADSVYEITVSDELGRLRVYLFDGETPTLIDTTYEDYCEALIEGIDEVGIEPERLIVTHEDPDHVEGFDTIVDEYDLETWVPEAGSFESDNDPDHEYGNGEMIGRFETIAVPGHTPGASALVDEDAGILVVGDVVVGSDWRGLPEGYLIPPPEAFSTDLVQAEQNLDQLLEYDFDTVLVFHGSSVSGEAYTKLDRFVNFSGRP